MKIQNGQSLVIWKNSNTSNQWKINCHVHDLEQIYLN